MVINRSPSPYLELNDGVQRMIVGPQKIHRIRCLAQYHAKVLNVISPSEIWIQLFSAITDQLRIEFTSELNCPARFEPNDYVMAPIGSTTLGRARILRQLSHNKVLVFLIDDGKYTVAGNDHLREMPAELRTYHWQAIGVALHSLTPINGKSWSHDEVNTVKTVIRAKDAVWVVPQLTVELINNDNEFTRVTLNVLNEDDIAEIYEKQRQTEFEHLGFSINQKFAMECKGQVRGPTMHDASRQLLYDADGEERYTKDSPVEFVIQKSRPDQNDTEDVWCNRIRDKKLYSFPNFDLATLEELGYVQRTNKDDLSITAILQGDYMHSTPRHFFGRVVRTTSKSDAANFEHSVNALKKLCKALDDFYGIRGNCHPLSPRLVYQELKKGERVFGVYEKLLCDDKGYLWHRVEILKVKTAKNNDTQSDQLSIYKIRYLDHGGQCSVLADSVYNIHSTHLKDPPFYLSLSLPYLIPYDTTSWTENQGAHFRSIIQSEGIVTCKVVKTQEPFDITDTIPVKELTPREKGSPGIKTIEQKLLRESTAASTVNERWPIDSHADESDTECITCMMSVSNIPYGAA